MRIFHISAECYPLAKVGGLADVVGALPKYINKTKHSACVVLPEYDTPAIKNTAFANVYTGKITSGKGTYNYSILLNETDFDFPIYLISIPELLQRPNIYSYKDDTERFIAFQIAFLDWLTVTKQQPDIIHCHDHHTGLIPFMMTSTEAFRHFHMIPTVLSIHNAQYQGGFGFEKIDLLPTFNLARINLLEWNGGINPLASAIKCAWRITTVSPSYLDELSIAANGLETLLLAERGKSFGILNGIDTEVWDPQYDPMIENFSINDYKSGKSNNKESLCSRFNLDSNLPLFTFIGRLVGEKGADILPEVCNMTLTYFKSKINILILGSGDKTTEKELLALQNSYQGNYNVHIGYDEKLAHQIYAGADFLLMPSRVEPCGLNQMYAMRYGTVPIVRSTGGLKDTVIDIDDNGFGICHKNTSVQDVVLAISRAIDLYADDKIMDAVRQKAMKIDHSWDKVAGEYINIYESLKP